MAPKNQRWWLTQDSEQVVINTAPERLDGGTRVTESYEAKWLPAWARILDVPTNRHRELLENMRHTLEQLKAVAKAVTEGERT